MNTTTTTTTTRATAERMYEALFPTAERIVKEGQEHAPMLFVQRTNDAQIAVLLLNGIEPPAMRMLHQRAAQDASVACAALVIEGWTFKARAGNADDQRIVEAITAGKVRTREVFNSESVIFSIRVGADMFMAMCEIDRKANTLAKGELQQNGQDGHSFHGRMVESEQQAAAN
jgi:hypothetical protein